MNHLNENSNFVPRAKYVFFPTDKTEMRFSIFFEPRRSRGQKIENLIEALSKGKTKVFPRGNERYFFPQRLGRKTTPSGMKKFFSSRSDEKKFFIPRVKKPPFWGCVKA